MCPASISFTEIAGQLSKEHYFLKFETVIKYGWMYAAAGCSGVHAFHLPACPPVTLI